MSKIEWVNYYGGEFHSQRLWPHIDGTVTVWDEAAQQNIRTDRLTAEMVQQQNQRIQATRKSALKPISVTEKKNDIT